MKYFTIEELTKSDTAIKLKINNTPSEKVKKSLIKLIENILDPLREKWGKPIIVSSGYRCPALNKAVGGVSTSQHLSGEATDIKANTRRKSDNKKLFDLILEMDLPFDQLIWEKGDASGPAWIHISYGPRNRKQVLHIK